MKRRSLGRMRHVSVLVVVLVMVTPILGAAAGERSRSTPTGHEVPEAQRTTLALYVTAREAYAKWKGAPEKVKILDVRTTEEFIFIGHAEMAWNIPFAVQTLEWNAAKSHFTMRPNPDFVSHARERFTPEDTLLVMCRSGTRSAMAVNALAKAGFQNVFNIIDGMEGDAIEDRENVYFGKRMKNGWKNSGVPWTYQIDPERMDLSEH